MEERISSYLLAGIAATTPQFGYCGDYSTNQAETPSVQAASSEDGTTKDIYTSLTNDTNNVLLLFITKGDCYTFQSFDDVQAKPAAFNDVTEVAQIVEQAKTILGINNVQLAKLVGVSRPSLYNHISGKEQPKSMEGYTKLYALLSRINKEVNGDISSGIKSVLVDGKTLLNRLKTIDFDEDEFVSAAQIVAKRMEGKPGSTSISSLRQKSVTRSLGSVG